MKLQHYILNQGWFVHMVCCALKWNTNKKYTIVHRTPFVMREGGQSTLGYIWAFFVMLGEGVSIISPQQLMYQLMWFLLPMQTQGNLSGKCVCQNPHPVLDYICHIPYPRHIFQSFLMSDSSVCVYRYSASEYTGWFKGLCQSPMGCTGASRSTQLVRCRVENMKGSAAGWKIWRVSCRVENRKGSAAGRALWVDQLQEGHYEWISCRGGGIMNG